MLKLSPAASDALPVKVGVVVFAVKALIVGVLGLVESITTLKPGDATLTFPAISVFLAVME